MMQFKEIQLCADDFGLNPGVSSAIIKLLIMRRLSAVSCMVNMSDFNIQAQELLQLEIPFLKGLHFNLTEGHFLAAPDKPCYHLNKLLIQTHLGLINTSLIAQEFSAQLNHFIDVMGALPDFIDGHQHVHQFPKIRQVVLEIYEQRLRQHKTLIRSTYPAITLPMFQFKGRILELTGGKKLSAYLQKNQIPHNVVFSGVYDFRQANYRNLFRQWLRLVP
ncbi:MAG: ChbG/HpnK family deacetylase, partial [bacterium]|nr:ChbG/HpnK family deacetylase [bacterium]